MSCGMLTLHSLLALFYVLVNIQSNKFSVTFELCIVSAYLDLYDKYYKIVEYKSNIQKSQIKTKSNSVIF